jgi:[ribosomal protein S5]-alanine N-acetyltransferase
VALFPDFGLKTEEARARHWIEKQLGRYAANTLGHQALIHKETGAFIGQSGLLLQEVDGRQEIEVGYHIFMKYWGQGYAPEAARAFMAYGFEQEGVDSIISIIDTRNTNSQRVAEKNGLQREKETSWSGLQVYVYRIHKADWLSSLSVRG